MQVNTPVAVAECVRREKLSAPTIDVEYFAFEAQASVTAVSWLSSESENRGLSGVEVRLCFDFDSAQPANTLPSCIVILDLYMQSRSTNTITSYSLAD